MKMILNKKRKVLAVEKTKIFFPEKFFVLNKYKN
jgi:hypothetical protein